MAGTAIDLIDCTTVSVLNAEVRRWLVVMARSVVINNLLQSRNEYPGIL
jgi:hypothetical protein